ncbi:alkaline phosphatase D family protein [Micromonospora inyonensis]|uniref:Alkaline phosphatase D n=1 Tax=Micromonospora inyonensis TaxID=47866 RepID=A0A1C6SHP6_9ACTN|nr:alkaline phosphatase D family protein [Micromonospora inyonensis]SCL29001.1 alkaline phosphatase D [Micromonospora inyonensis]
MGQSDVNEAGLGRRRFLTLAGAGLLAAGTVAATSGRALAVSPVGRDPFTLGVASGDALTDRVVIWTRLAPEPLDPSSRFGMGDLTEVPVRWRLAKTESHLGAPSRWIASGAAVAVADNGFSVHVDVAGLDAGRHYFYEFEVDGPDGTVLRSPVGRTHTAFAADDDRTARFAVVTCQNVARADGGEFYFHGHDHLAGREDIDFVVFLGDYFYEFGRAAHVPPREISSLDDYRTRYGQYRLRDSLREVHRRFPVYVMPDDHEFFNDYRGGDLTGVGQIRRFNRALQALWENMPLRNGHPGPLGDTKNHLALYRRIAWGTNLDLYLTDVRQYRGTSLLGNAQTDDLLDWLRTTTATWTALATPTPIWWNGGNNGWNGFTGVRDRVTAVLEERKAATPATFNPVVLSGDIHCGIVTHVRRFRDHSSPFVATEFINAPMTSQTSNHFLPDDEIRGAYNGRYGYMECTAEPTGWKVRYVVGDQTDDPNGTATGQPPWHLDAGDAPGTVYQPVHQKA